MAPTAITALNATANSMLFGARIVTISPCFRPSSASPALDSPDRLGEFAVGEDPAAWSVDQRRLRPKPLRVAQHEFSHGDIGNFDIGIGTAE